MAATSDQQQRSVLHVGRRPIGGTRMRSTGRQRWRRYRRCWYSPPAAAARTVRLSGAGDPPRLSSSGTRGVSETKAFRTSRTHHPPRRRLRVSNQFGPAKRSEPQQPDVQDCHPDVPLIGTRREAATPPAGANITEELRWARCTRSHGVPSFPDPNRQRAFDSSSKFDPHLTRVSGRQHDLQIGAPTGRAAAVPGPGPSAP